MKFGSKFSHTHTHTSLSFLCFAVATANLVTAITAVKANLGVTLVAYIFTILGVAWTVLWALAYAGVQSATECSDESTVCTPSGIYVFLLLLALFFVQQVIQNSVHVTVAGTVATWCKCSWRAFATLAATILTLSTPTLTGYSPAESGCCSSAVCNSFLRTITTSLGSICFGSLLVAIIQALKSMARQAQEDGECNILACIAQCILGCIESIVEYFNKWAFMCVYR